MTGRARDGRAPRSPAQAHGTLFRELLRLYRRKPRIRGLNRIEDMKNRQWYAYLGTMAGLAVLVANPTEYGLADSVERQVSDRTRQGVPATREPVDADHIVSVVIDGRGEYADSELLPRHDKGTLE